MRRLLIVLATVFLLMQPISAMEYTAPSVTGEAEKYMPEKTDSFGEGLWYVVRSALDQAQPDIMEAARTCLSAVAVVMLLAVVGNFTGVSKEITGLVGALSLGVLLLNASNSLIQLGTETVEKVGDYGKLLLPTLTAAMAAGGMPTTSAALYTGTVVFTTILSSLIGKVVVPLIYVFMCLSIANCASEGQMFKGLKDFVKWLSTWVVKTVLYLFTGYMSVTGVISGSVDATAVKATKLTISGAVPVVGGILSDASETILLSAGIMKNAAGIYGILAIIAVCIGPFLRIGIHYLLLKLTSAVCSVFGSKSVVGLFKDMTGAMGLVLAMTGTVCLLFLISIVCFLRSVS